MSTEQMKYYQRKLAYEMDSVDPCEDLRIRTKYCFLCHLSHYLPHNARIEYLAVRLSQLLAQSLASRKSA